MLVYCVDDVHLNCEAFSIGEGSRHSPQVYRLSVRYRGTKKMALLMQSGQVGRHCEQALLIPKDEGAFILLRTKELGLNMLTMQFILDHAELVQQATVHKNIPFQVDKLLEWDSNSNSSNMR